MIPELDIPVKRVSSRTELQTHGKSHHNMSEFCAVEFPEDSWMLIFLTEDTPKSPGNIEAPVILVDCTTVTTCAGFAEYPTSSSQVRGNVRILGQIFVDYKHT
uniref:Uncharacterized protein n=1 Tax=Cacopsylla melanoneura TaxID=428564 RepID=A0A8D8QHF6_9HEMI